MFKKNKKKVVFQIEPFYNDRDLNLIITFGRVIIKQTKIKDKT